MSVLSLITGASVLVQIVMLILLLASLLSWYYIFLKIFTFKRATRLADDFEKKFWSGADLNELYQRAVAARDTAGSQERIFEAGFQEFIKLRKQPNMDIRTVLDGTSRGPVPFVGHSKGGAVLSHLAEACPHRCTKLVNIDGLPSREPLPDVTDHERTRRFANEVGRWRDRRRAAASAERKPGTLDDLARRRARMNPRLPHAWLRYIATIGARRDRDGWRWKEYSSERTSSG